MGEFQPDLDPGRGHDQPTGGDKSNLLSKFQLPVRTILSCHKLQVDAEDTGKVMGFAASASSLSPLHPTQKSS